MPSLEDIRDQAEFLTDFVGNGMLEIIEQLQESSDVITSPGFNPREDWLAVTRLEQAIEMLNDSHQTTLETLEQIMRDIDEMSY